VKNAKGEIINQRIIICFLLLMFSCSSPSPSSGDSLYLLAFVLRVNDSTPLMIRNCEEHYMPDISIEVSKLERRFSRRGMNCIGGEGIDYTCKGRLKRGKILVIKNYAECKKYLKKIVFKLRSN
jgi:hypothetical protein